VYHPSSPEGEHEGERQAAGSKVNAVAVTVRQGVVNRRRPLFRQFRAARVFFTYIIRQSRIFDGVAR